MRLAWLCLIALLLPSQARADLASDVKALDLGYRSWGQSSGASVEVLEPRVLERYERLPLLFLSELLDREGPSAEESCQRVIVLSAKTTNFMVGRVAPGSLPWVSVGGVIEFEECGKREPLQAFVEVRAPRGVVQALRVRSRGRSPEVSDWLPHRRPGPLAAMPHLSPHFVLRPLEARRKQILEDARRDPKVVIREWVVKPTQGNIGMELARGCHKVTVLQHDVDGSRRQIDDLDLEVRDADGAETLGRDVSSNLDAKATFCTPQKGQVLLRITGREGGTMVTLIHERHPFPEGIPTSLGVTAASNFALELFRSNVSRVPEEPSFQFIGVQGRTLATVPVEPGFCYLALAATSVGRFSYLSLRATVGPTPHEDQRDARSNGALLAFCSGGVEQAMLEVSARGSGAAFAVSVWKMAPIPIGENPE